MIEAFGDIQLLEVFCHEVCIFSMKILEDQFFSFWLMSRSEKYFLSLRLFVYAHRCKTFGKTALEGSSTDFCAIFLYNVYKLVYHKFSRFLKFHSELRPQQLVVRFVLNQCSYSRRLSIRRRIVCRCKQLSFHIQSPPLPSK